jgi:hypothetical protein
MLGWDADRLGEQGTQVPFADAELPGQGSHPLRAGTGRQAAQRRCAR